MEESSEPVEATASPAVEEASVSAPVEEVVEEAQPQEETDLEKAARIAREKQKQEGLNLKEKQEYRSKFETLADASAKQMISPLQNHAIRNTTNTRKKRSAVSQPLT